MVQIGPVPGRSQGSGVSCPFAMRDNVGHMPGLSAGKADVNSQGVRAARTEKRAQIEIKCVVCARPTCMHSVLKFLQVVGLFKATTGETGVAVGSFVWL